VYVCMYVCMRAFITRRSYSLTSHEVWPRLRHKTLDKRRLLVFLAARKDGLVAPSENERNH